MTSPLDVSPVKVEIKSEKKKTRLIYEAKTDSFGVCETKIIEKPKLFGLRKEKLLVHRIEGEENWEIQAL